MSTKKALMLSVLIPVGLALALPVAAMGPGGQGGQMDRPAFTDLDADGNGELTLDEMLAHREARFAEADTDGDGNLSRDEMIAAAMGRVEAAIDRRMERFDDNEDGLLSANEMDDMRPRGPSPERIFGHMDADGDGVVTAEEFETAAADMMQRRGGMGGQGRHGGGEGHGHRGGDHDGQGGGHGHHWWQSDEG